MPLNKVTIEDDFWAPRMKVNREKTLLAAHKQLRDTGRIDAFRLDWKPGMEPQPHRFWDSDVAKWVEAASYSLATHPDPELEKLVEEVVDKIIGAQHPDGYLNVFYTVVEPENRWKNLRDWHELYCAGHLIEAAVAHHQATGKRDFLDATIRYADYIDSVFGDEPGKRYGAPGHEEIELALVKLYHATGEGRYLKLSEFFLNQRGQKPSVFQLERPDEEYRAEPGYHQDHLPVREQSTAEGHAVRAMYLYSGMADVAAETGDEELLSACEKLWENVTTKRMYITGGIGSTSEGERFTTDYDLPNATAYAETCAGIGLVFWAHRMLQFGPDSRYADVMERALYNGVISGVSLDGERFFYVNPLESAGDHHRQEWFGCACCPPNIARLIASLGGYIYSQADNDVYVHLYVQGEAELEVAGQKVMLRQETDYPWDGLVRVTVRPERPVRFGLNLRLSGWCLGAMLAVNGQLCKMTENVTDGYVRIEREWTGEETVELGVAMPTLLSEAHPAMKAAAGRVALQRGPIVYCLEQADNPIPLHQIVLPYDQELPLELVEEHREGAVVVKAQAQAAQDSDWRGALYRPEPTRMAPFEMTAVPYCVWDNRSPGEMLVWIRMC